jgi:hypothetical protein
VVDQAGAVLVSEVALTPQYGASERAGALDDLALRLAPPGAEIPSEGGPRARADAALAASLLLRGDAPGGSATASAGLLSAFEQVGAIAFDGDAERGAELALLIVPAGGGETDALVGLAQALGQAKGVVVITGSPLGPGDTVSVLRTSQPPADSVATVDGADRAPGRVAVVDASEAALEGVFGSYGRSLVLSAPAASPAEADGSG